LNCLTVQNLTKKYGENSGVSDVSFTLSKGTILGVLGPNGAGKSTLLETILGLRKKNSGIVKIFENKLLTKVIKKKIGYQLQTNYINYDCYVSDYIRLFKTIFNVENPDEIIKKKFGIDNIFNKKIYTLSRGQYQRFVLTLAFLHNPELVFLDEPFTGLDPVSRNVLKKILNEYKGKGVSIIINTHDINEIETICDEILILNNSKVVVCDRVDNVLKNKNISLMDYYLQIFGEF
jgi:ABC-2 type transport system ATP-binding protein